MSALQGVISAAGYRAGEIRAQLRWWLLAALPVAILVISPERPTVSIAGALAYAVAAVFLTTRRTTGDRWSGWYCVVVGGLMLIALARVELWNHSTVEQASYAATKAIYFVAVILPMALAVTHLVTDGEDLRPVVVGFLAVGICLTLATLVTRNPYLLGQSRYTWQGNLIAIAALLLLQYWLVSGWKAAALAVLGLLAAFVTTSRQSVIAIGLGLAITAAFWALAGRANPKRLSERRSWAFPLALVAVWTLVLAGFLAIGQAHRAGIHLPSFLPDPATCQCSLSHFNELLAGSGHGDSNRILLLNFGLTLAAKNPLFGAGLGALVGYLPKDEYPHNLALELAAEMGIPAAIAILTPLLLGWLSLLRSGIKAASPPLVSLAMIVLVFAVVAGFADDLAGNRMFWIFALIALKLSVDARTMKLKAAAG